MHLLLHLTLLLRWLMDRLNRLMRLLLLLLLMLLKLLQHLMLLLRNATRRLYIEVLLLLELRLLLEFQLQLLCDHHRVGVELVVARLTYYILKGTNIR